MDIIACQACGTRLLFSTPSSWNHQQIEKAASVFSLKLDNGHKLLCPWIDNACEDTLAQFPPTTASVLIDGYQERSRALIQLSALPMISSSAFEHMKGPQLESFLKLSSTLEFDVGFGNTFTTEVLGDEQEAISAKIYNQAQKLISLCGWEPRLLPYVVDRTSSKCGVYEAIDVNDEHQSDQASVVLDCKLCGASVGLWAFSTVPRPLELVRLVESSGDIVETDGSRELVSYNGGLQHTSTSSQGQPSSLNLSIGGGPSPAKQNFRATVSFPIVSRHVRVGLISNFRVRDNSNSSMSYTNLKSRQCDLHIPESLQYEKDSRSTDTVQSEDMVPSSDNGVLIFRNDSPSGLNHESLGVLSNEERFHYTLETIHVSRTNITEGREIMPHGSEENNITSQILKEMDPKQKQVNNVMKFDPIRQHRHFCPWVLLIGSAAPGWQQTLSVLDRTKEASHVIFPDSPSLSSFEVDDPIASVRRLFMSPQMKKMKTRV